MTCPYCGSLRVYRSNSLFLHTLRTLSDSNKRYCAGCKKRWQARHGGGWRPLLYAGFLMLILFAAMLAAVKAADQGFFNRHFRGRSQKAVSASEDPTEEILKHRIKAGQIQRRARLIESQERRL